jgi:queuine tRNA-ribosyltransferase
LVKSDEILGSMLLTWHNLTFYQRLMMALRDAIAAGALAPLVRQVRDAYSRAAG